MTDRTDAELVQATRAGNPEPYGELVARYQGHVYGLAYSLVGDWTDAQDVAQETFVRAYTNLDRLQDPQRFAAWLRRVAFSVTLNWMRAHRPALYQHVSDVDLDALELPDFEPGPQEVVERRELARVVLRAVGALPAKYRVPITMFHLDGLSYQKVADFLDIPLGTAKTLIHRARAKLRDALAPYVLEEITPMVQEVFDEHKLPAEFAAKVLQNVPTLAWNRECTFLGALEAALAITPHPFRYHDLMGWSGMAFRTRWFGGNDTGARWCPSSAVGEMEEEIEAVGETTGWPLHFEHLDTKDAAAVQRLTADLTTSINSGKPVLVYDPGMDMAVAYGYEDRGKSLLLRGYDRGEEPLRLPPAKLGFMLLFLEEHRDGLSRRDALLNALQRAVRNWERQQFHEGPGDYWYGKAAYARWIADLQGAGGYTDEERGFLRGVSGFCFFTLRGARRSAVTFLRDNASLLDAPAAAALERAAAIYEQEAELLHKDFSAGTAFARDGSEWTPEVRAREAAILTQACAMEEKAMAELKKGL